MIHRPAHLKISQASLPLPTNLPSPFLPVLEASTTQIASTHYTGGQTQGLPEKEFLDPVQPRSAIQVVRSSCRGDPCPAQWPANPLGAQLLPARPEPDHKISDQALKPEIGSCKDGEPGKLNAQPVCNSEERTDNLGPGPSFDFSAYSAKIMSRAATTRPAGLLGQKRPLGEAAQLVSELSLQPDGAQHFIKQSLKRHQQYEVQGFSSLLEAQPAQQSLLPGSTGLSPSVAFGYLQHQGRGSRGDIDKGIISGNPAEDLALFEEMRHLTNNGLNPSGIPQIPQIPADLTSELARLEDAQFECCISPVFQPQRTVFGTQMQAHLAENFSHINPEWPVKIILGQDFNHVECGPPPETVSRSKRFLVYHFKKPRGKADYRLFECLHTRSHFDKCHKLFSNLSKFYDHLRTHTKEKPFTCSICGEGFGQRGNLVAHVSQRHLRDRRFPCRFCGQEFSRKNNMRAHERSHLE